MRIPNGNISGGKPWLAIELLAEENRSLPKLAWLCSLERETGTLRVFHGSAVEVRPHFIVEGVWDGPFAEGAFHRAGHFFGSGVRIEDDTVWLCPSHALVDRIVYCSRGSEVLASNSLALLLGYTGAELVPEYDYRKVANAILRGIDLYDPEIPVRHSRIAVFYQAFHHPVVITRERIERVRCAATARREFSCFEAYVGTMRRDLARIRQNIESADRRVPLNAFTTISAGYDSTAVTALVRDFGIQGCFTSPRSAFRIPLWMNRRRTVDDGTPIAKHLGLRTITLRIRRRQITDDEIYFLAPGAPASELVFHSLAQHIERECRAAVLFTGYHGDKVWDMHTSDPYLTDEIKRPDVMGMGLSEIRLKAGFVNVAVPFMHSRSVSELVRIAHSAEMQPWSVGDAEYDRPIPRRILEEMGVPREAFGQGKKGQGRQFKYPVHRGLRRLYFEHVRIQHGWRPAFLYFHAKANLIAYLGARALQHLLGKREKHTPVFFWPEVDSAYEMHVWALQTLARDLGRVLTRGSEKQPSPGDAGGAQGGRSEA